jgi:hypothetical protein
MVERNGGQWNVATKENTVYLERVSEDREQLFEDLLEPEEARQLARLLTKHADKLSESKPPGKADKDDDEDEDDEDNEGDEGDDPDEDGKSEDSENSAD